MNILEIVAIIGGIAGIVSLIIQSRESKSKIKQSEATAANQLTDAAMDIVQRLECQVEILRGEIKEFKVEDNIRKTTINTMRQEIDTLKRELSLRDSRITELETENTRLKREIGRLKARLLELEGKSKGDI